MATQDVKVTKTGNIYTLSKNNCKVTITDVDNNGLTGNDSIMVKGDIKNSGISAAEISKALSDNGYKPGETKGTFEDVKINNNTAIFKQEKKYNLSSFERFLHSAAETQTQPQAPATQVQRTTNNSADAAYNTSSGLDVQGMQKNVSKWSAFTSMLSVGGLMGAESLTGGGFLGNILMPAAMNSVATGLYQDMQTSFQGSQPNVGGNDKLQAIIENALAPVTAEEEAAYSSNNSASTARNTNSGVAGVDYNGNEVSEETEPERTVVRSKTLADGSTVTEYDDGTQEIQYKDGRKSEMYVDDEGYKHVVRYDKNGDQTEETTQYEDLKMTTYADGRTVKEFKGGERNESHTDTNGNLIIVRYDKNKKLVDVQCVDPEGKVTKAKANGKWSVEELTAALLKAKGQKPDATVQNAKSKKAEASQICKDFFVSMKEAGTDEDLLKKAEDKVKKNNVLEVFEQWDKNYAASMDGETLVESINNDIYDGEDKHINKLKTALVLRAKELGLEEEAEAFDAQVTVEMNRSAWLGGTNDDVVERLFTEMVTKAIAARDGKTSEE